MNASSSALEPRSWRSWARQSVSQWAAALELWLEDLKRGADGKLLRGPENLLVRDCVETCGCGVIPTCDNCPDATPGQFHVTFTGIALCTGCAQCDLADLSAQITSSGAFSGTFVLSRNGVCAWTTDPSLVALSGSRFGASDCSGASAPITFAIQQVRINASQWRLQITDDSNTILLFDAVVTSPCCQPYTVDNALTDCGCADSSTLAAATGGTATVTPC